MRAMKLILLTFVFFLVRTVPKLSVLGHQYIDLSYSFDKFTIIGWGEDKPFEMVVTENGTTEFGVWMQSEEIGTGTHAGTHMDAPCHAARGRWTLDQIPLERFFAPAAVVDITSRVASDSDALLLVEDLQRWEMATGRSLNDTIVLVRTGWSSRWPDQDAYTGNSNNDIDDLHFPGISAEATTWLVQKRRIYGLGIESLSLDGGKNIGRRTLPAHKILLSENIYGLENVATLERLPLFGAMLHVLPMKIKGACGGPVRIVARLSSLHDFI